MSRISREVKTVKAMTEMYCKEFHGLRGGRMCGKCSELYDYAVEKLKKCPFGEGKPACKKCHVHCYNKEKKEKIKKVMKYAGPRMIFKHPGLTLWHFIGAW